MPIVRTYMCNDCARMFTVTLALSQADDPPPDCPTCSARTRQEYQPVAVHGVKARNADDARKMAEKIAVEDYGVENMNIKNYEGEPNKVTYKQPAAPPLGPSTWGATSDTIAGALAEGRAMRRQYGSGLDVLARNLETGAQPDLIEVSKRRSMKVWT